MDPERVTRLLERATSGDRAAAEELLPLLYGELKGVAVRSMRSERADHTLQPTALVHEAWLRLVGGGGAPRFESRRHFVRLAARAMRNVLVDHARARQAQKRGEGQEAASLDAVLAGFEEQHLDLLALHEALERLQEIDAPLARLVELRFFAGLTIEETARALELSTPTVERHWRVARMWLRRELPDAP